MDKKSFIIYQNWAKLLENLEDDKAGMLIKAICSHVNGRDVNIKDETINAIFQMIVERIAEDTEKYAEVVKKRTEAGKKGLASRWQTIANANEEMANANKCHNLLGVTDTVTDTVTVTDTDNVSPTEIKKEKVSPNGDTKKKNPNPPSLEEVREYCQQRNSSVDPEQFYEYFNTGGWVDSKGNKVKNWKQKVITWEKFNQGHGDNRASKITPFDANSYILSKIRGGGQ